MYDTHSHSASDRIVSVSQPFLRPIVRGKAGKPVEFGAKLDISVVNGWSRLECFSFDAYNEAGNLQDMLIISQWWMSRSRIAVVMVASPRKSAHSSKPLLEVIISEVFSDMNGLNKRIGSLETQLRNTGDSLNGRMDHLESGPESLISSYSESFAGVDLQERAVQIKVTITTAQNIQEKDPEILVNGNGDAGKFSWPEPPLSYNSAEDNSYSVKLELPMDASNMELLFSAGGVSEMLQTFSSISELLPVQLGYCNGDTIYNANKRIFYQTEWCAELSDPNVASAAFRIYKNGKLQEESLCELAQHVVKYLLSSHQLKWPRLNLHSAVMRLADPPHLS